MSLEEAGQRRLLLLACFCVLLSREEPKKLPLKSFLKSGRSAAALPMIIPRPGSMVVTMVSLAVSSIYWGKKSMVRLSFCPSNWNEKRW